MDSSWKEGMLKDISSAVGDGIAQTVTSCQCGRMQEGGFVWQ